MKHALRSFLVLSIYCLVGAVHESSAQTATAAASGPRKVLFLGNSITRHGPKADIGWEGNWGMAATTAEKDYVHIVTKALTEKSGQAPQVQVQGGAEFERAYAAFDAAAKLKDAIDFKPDLIILAIGENVPGLKNEEEKKQFQGSVTKLLRALKGNGKPTIIVRSSFWANEAKDDAMRQACAEVGGIYVDIGALGKDEANYARSERDIKHAGVGRHPGDKGMQAIADAIVKALPK